jgi:uncharacterized protein YukE
MNGNEELLEKKSLKEKVKEAIDVGGEGTVSIIGGIMAESIVGQVLPGVTTAAFSYKQKRHEKNMVKFIDLCNQRHEEFSKHLHDLEEKQLEYFSRCVELITDYVLDEPQEEKIEYMVNGLVDLSSHEEIHEDFVLHYYDALRELRLVDLDILNNYYLPFGDYSEIIKKHNLSSEQYQSVRLKLTRNGLLKTKFDDQMEDLYENMINLQVFLEDLNKGKSKKLKRLNRLKKRDNFSISKFGRDFVEFFLEINSQENTKLEIDHLL